VGGALAVGALVTILAIQIAKQAFLNALSNTVPQGVSGALFDAVANSVKMGFRFILVVGLVAVILAFLTRLSSYARYIARPAELVVLVLAAIALIAPDTYSWLYIIIVLLLTAVTIACLEAARRHQLATAPPADTPAPA
jgi:hypothetical protein